MEANLHRPRSDSTSSNNQQRPRSDSISSNNGGRSRANSLKNSGSASQNIISTARAFYERSREAKGSHILLRNGDVQIVEPVATKMLQPREIQVLCRDIDSFLKFEKFKNLKDSKDLSNAKYIIKALFNFSVGFEEKLPNLPKPLGESLKLEIGSYDLVTLSETLKVLKWFNKIPEDLKDKVLRRLLESKLEISEELSGLDFVWDDITSDLQEKVFSKLFKVKYIFGFDVSATPIDLKLVIQRIMFLTEIGLDWSSLGQEKIEIAHEITNKKLIDACFIISKFEVKECLECLLALKKIGLKWKYLDPKVRNAFLNGFNMQILLPECKLQIMADILAVLADMGVEKEHLTTPDLAGYSFVFNILNELRKNITETKINAAHCLSLLVTFDKMDLMGELTIDILDSLFKLIRKDIVNLRLDESLSALLVYARYENKSYINEKFVKALIKSAYNKYRDNPDFEDHKLYILHEVFCRLKMKGELFSVAFQEEIIKKSENNLDKKSQENRSILELQVIDFFEQKKLKHKPSHRIDFCSPVILLGKNIITQAGPKDRSARLWESYLKAKGYNFIYISDSLSIESSLKAALPTCMTNIEELTGKTTRSVLFKPPIAPSRKLYRNGKLLTVDTINTSAEAKVERRSKETPSQSTPLTDRENTPPTDTEDSPLMGTLFSSSPRLTSRNR